MKVTYSSNNSGGSFWLSDQNWRDLEAAGWNVEWKPKRWLGTLASEATREGLTMAQAIEEWERVTGLDSSELGCYTCCGPPHSFSTESEYWSPDAPRTGSRYGSEA